LCAGISILSVDCYSICHIELKIAIAVLTITLTWEAVNTWCYGTLIGQVSGNATLVLSSCSSNEGRVENQTILGCISFGLKSSESDQTWTY